jgi:hypothetical protein
MSTSGVTTVTAIGATVYRIAAQYYCNVLVTVYLLSRSSHVISLHLLVILVPATALLAV